MSDDDMLTEPKKTYNNSDDDSDVVDGDYANGIANRKRFLINEIARLFKTGGKFEITTDGEIIMAAYGTQAEPGAFSPASGFTIKRNKEHVIELLLNLKNSGFVHTEYDPSSGVTYVSNIKLAQDKQKIDKIDFGTSNQVDDIAVNTNLTLEIASANKSTCFKDNCKKAFRSLINFCFKSDPEFTNIFGHSAAGGKRKSKKSKKSKKTKSKKSKTKKNRSR